MLCNNITSMVALHSQGRGLPVSYSCIVHLRRAFTTLEGITSWEAIILHMRDNHFILASSAKETPARATTNNPLHTDPQQALLAKLRCTLCMALLFWQKLLTWLDVCLSVWSLLWASVLHNIVWVVEDWKFKFPVRSLSLVDSEIASGLSPKCNTTQPCDMAALANTVLFPSPSLNTSSQESFCHVMADNQPPIVGPSTRAWWMVVIGCNRTIEWFMMNTLCATSNEKGLLAKGNNVIHVAIFQQQMNCIQSMIGKSSPQEISWSSGKEHVKHLLTWLDHLHQSTHLCHFIPPCFALKYQTSMFFCICYSPWPEHLVKSVPAILYY